jgi:hypothetical protein
MITLLYSTLATPNHPFADATLLVTDDQHYLLSIPTMPDWTSAVIQINQYPAVDIIIENQVMEIEGILYEPEEELWVDIIIAKGPNFGGSYRFPLEVVPLPTQMPRFANSEGEVIHRERSLWWKKPRKNPILFFWEKYDFQLFFYPRTSSR